MSNVSWNNDGDSSDDDDDDSCDGDVVCDIRYVCWVSILVSWCATDTNVYSVNDTSLCSCWWVEYDGVVRGGPSPPQYAIMARGERERQETRDLDNMTYG